MFRDAKLFEKVTLGLVLVWLFGICFSQHLSPYQIGALVLSIVPVLTVPLCAHVGYQKFKSRWLK